MNRFIALILLLIVLPFLVIVGCFIIIFEQESVFFIQERIGKNKIPFKLIKIRTMQNNQITYIGSILRKTGIDEIPQLINILKGEMNFIGPRPLTKNDIERLGWQTEYYQKRWNVKPGLTGLAQLSPICHKKMSFFFDLYYTKNRRIRLDLGILLMSFLVLFVGKQKVKKIILKRHNRKYRLKKNNL